MKKDDSQKSNYGCLTEPWFGLKGLKILLQSKGCVTHTSWIYILIIKTLFHTLAWKAAVDGSQPYSSYLARIFPHLKFIFIGWKLWLKIWKKKWFDCRTESDWQTGPLRYFCSAEPFDFEIGNPFPFGWFICSLRIIQTWAISSPLGDTDPIWRAESQSNLFHFSFTFRRTWQFWHSSIVIANRKFKSEKLKKYIVLKLER